MRAVMTMLLLGLVLATAQDVPLSPVGHPSLRPQCTIPRVDTFDLVIVGPGQGERKVSTLIRTRSTGAERAGVTCILVQRYERPGGSDVDSSVIDAGTLAPIRYTAAVGPARHLFRFRPDSVTGTVEHPDSAPRTIVHRAETSYFLGVADLEVLRALRLLPGLRARFAFYNPPMGFGTLVIQVQGLDTLTVSGRRELAWRLSYDAGGAPTVVWLRQADGELLRSRSTLSNGAIFWRRKPGDIHP